MNTAVLGAKVSTMAVGLALVALTASITANAEAVVRSEQGGEGAWAWAEHGCRYFYVDTVRHMIDGAAATYLHYGVGDSCTGARGYGWGLIPNEALTGAATRGRSLELVVSTEDLDQERFLGDGAPAALAVTWKPDVVCRRSLDSQRGDERAARGGAKRAAPSHEQPGAPCSEARFSVTGPVAFSGATTLAAMGEDRSADHRFEAGGPSPEIRTAVHRRGLAWLRAARQSHRAAATSREGKGPSDGPAARADGRGAADPSGRLPRAVGR